MKMNRPKGSINVARFNELCRLSQTDDIDIYQVSHKFQYYQKKILHKARIIFSQRDSENYNYIGFLFDGTRNETEFIPSMLDMNMPLNGYNDWYLFEDPEIAAQFLKTGVYKGF